MTIFHRIAAAIRQVLSAPAEASLDVPKSPEVVLIHSSLDSVQQLVEELAVVFDGHGEVTDVVEYARSWLAAAKQAQDSHLGNGAKQKSIRYILSPGWVTSKTDGDRHYLSSVDLQRLYGVRADECVVMDDLWSIGQRTSFLARYPGLPVLAPRFDGMYSHPDAAPLPKLPPTQVPQAFSAWLESHEALTLGRDVADTREYSVWSMRDAYLAGRSEVGAVAPFPEAVLKYLKHLAEDKRKRLTPVAMFQGRNQHELLLVETACKLLASQLSSEHLNVGPLRDLIQQYFDAGFREGAEGRTSDTVDGTAQRIWSQIDEVLSMLPTVPTPVGVVIQHDVDTNNVVWHNLSCDQPLSAGTTLYTLN